MLAFRFLSCDNEQSNVRARVAIAEFLVNFRTHQICLSHTESANVIFQQETETTHVSNFQFVLYSQPVGLELFVELVTRGVEHPADILS